MKDEKKGEDENERGSGKGLTGKRTKRRRNDLAHPQSFCYHLVLKKCSLLPNWEVYMVMYDEKIK